MEGFSRRIQNSAKWPFGRMNDNASCEEISGIKPPNLLKSKKPSIIDKTHVETDLVHMSGKHNALALLGGPLFMGYQVAHRVDGHLIHTPLELPLYDLSYILLTAWNTCRLRKLTE